MDGWERYFTKSAENLERVRATQGDNIMKAAQLMADCTEQGGIIRAFGCGHSHLITEDIFWRSATLANVQTIVESVMTGQAEITKSGKLEQIEGYGQMVFAYHRIASPDVVLCVSNSGNNQVTVDFARAARDAGVPVIAITNVEYSDFLNTRHSLGINLKDVADVVIDNCSEIGDAVVDIDGFDLKVGASSTIPGVCIQTALIVQTVELLVKKGIKPDVYYNGHLEVNDGSTKVHNDAIVDKYYYKIRNL